MDKLKLVFVALGATVSSALGILYLPVLLMVLCNVMDYVTAILAAIYNGEKVDSAIGIQGIIKKVSMWLLVVVGVIADHLIAYATEYMGVTFPLMFLVACIVAVWIICNELISILENIKKSGVKVPVFIEKILHYVKDKTEQAGSISGTQKTECERKSEGQENEQTKNL